MTLAEAVYFAGREKEESEGWRSRVWNRGSGHFPFPIPLPDPKGNDYTEVTPRNSKGPLLGIITMLEEEYLFLRQQE